MGKAKKVEPVAAAAAEEKKEDKKEEKAEEKKEEKSEEKKEEKAEEKSAEKKEEKEEDKGEKKEAAVEEAEPPPPVVLHVDLHCKGCCKKIRRCLLKCKGVEGVETDMEKNEVTVKGIVEPEALCTKILKKAHRKATVISPLPPPPPAEGAEPEKPPQVVHSQVSEVNTVEIQVNMHCEACAEQLQKKMLKMRGVQTAEADLGASKLTVTGTVAGDKIVEYIYRRTGKIAVVIPPPPPPPKEEEAAKDGGEKKGEDNKGEKKGEENKEGEKEAEKEKGEGDKKEKDGGGEEVVAAVAEEDAMKRMVYWNRPAWSVPTWNYVNYYQPAAYQPPPMLPAAAPAWHGAPRYYSYEEEMMRMRMMQMMPAYAAEPSPPPELFSDENPNACAIS